jgi:hypothetical protein
VIKRKVKEVERGWEGEGLWLSVLCSTWGTMTFIGVRRRGGTAIAYWEKAIGRGSKRQRGKRSNENRGFGSETWERKNNNFGRSKTKQKKSHKRSLSPVCVYVVVAVA